MSGYLSVATMLAQKAFCHPVDWHKPRLHCRVCRDPRMHCRPRAAVAIVAALAYAGCGGSDPSPPRPAAGGCITEVSPGAHTFICEGLRTDLFVPPACE